MKRLHFSRRQIVRAVQAAALALFLLARPGAAQAQTATGDGHGDVTISGSGSASFDLTPSSSPPLTSGGTVTIASGASIAQTSNSAYVGLTIESASTLLSNGTVSVNDTDGNAANGIIYSTLPTGSVTVTNSGSGYIAATSATNYARGLYVQEVETGSFILNNSGTITATGLDELALGVFSHVGLGATAITNQAGGTISAVSGSSNYGAGIVSIADLGPVTISNAGTISGTGASSPGFGILVSSGGGSVAIANSGLVAAALQSSSDSGNLVGVYVDSSMGTGTVTVANTGTVTAEGTTNTADGFELTSSATGGMTVTNSGVVTVTAGHAANGFDIHDGSSALTINTTGAGVITVTSTHSAAYGINVAGSREVSITNSETINATSGSGYGGAITVNDTTGTTTITNTGTVTGTSATEAGEGIQATDTHGMIVIFNRGQIVANTAGNGGTSCSGIYAYTPTGTMSIVNAGSIYGNTTNGAQGYGIAGRGQATVANTGTITGTYAGVILQSATALTNSGSGLISGGVYAINLPTNSSVTLEGTSRVSGLMRGGSNDNSTSLLNFDLTVPMTQLGADKTALDAAIASYTTDVGAHPGSTVESEVVTINGVDYQWENFADVTDGLTAGHRYGTFAGYLGLGSAIDHFNTGSARAGSILAALGNLSAAAVPSALAQLSPRSLGLLRNIAFDGAGFSSARLDDHLANLRDGLTGFDTAGFSINAPGTDPVLSGVRSQLLAWNPAPDSSGLLSDSPGPLFAAADAKDMKNAVMTEPEDRWSSFISGSVILADLDNTLSNTGDANYTTGSVTAGVDYRLDNRFTVGALFDYSHTGADLDGNGSKATVDSYAPGVYGSYVEGPWYANGLFSYGFDRTTEDRRVTIPGIAGDNRGAADGGQVASSLTGGYEFQRGGFKFGPVAAIQYVHLRIDPFAESGPASLATGGEDDDSLRTQLGFETHYTTATQTAFGRLNLTPHFRASWQHECLDNSNGITASFNNTGGGSFVVQGEQAQRDSAFLDLGLDAGVTGNLTLFVDYQTQAGQADFFAQAAQGGVRIGF